MDKIIFCLSRILILKITNKSKKKTLQFTT